MLAEFYSHVQNPKETVKEFGESLLQIARKIMTAKPEFKVDIEKHSKGTFRRWFERSLPSSNGKGDDPIPPYFKLRRLQIRGP